MQNDELLFANDEGENAEKLPLATWKILIVDDEPEIHTITKMVLAEFRFESRRLEFHSAQTAKAAKTILANDKQQTFAVALVDVVMESSHAGLDLVRWIRETLNNKGLRIILRTGQPGEAPEERVISDYDINDYKNKTELTAMRLKTAMYTALRAYRDIKLIERQRMGLEKIINATTQFIECDTLPQFASTILNQISIILGIESSEIICCAVTRDADHSHHYNILASNLTTHPRTSLPPEIKQRIEHALADKTNVKGEDFFVSYFTTRKGMENVLYVARNEELETVQHHLLNFFAHNIAVSHENLRLREIIHESQKELSYIIGEAVEIRSKETGSHVRRVAHISYLLSIYAGLDESTAQMIKLASPLHDVGKVAIPDLILNKPGKHTEEETKIMRTHAKAGYDMLRKSANPILQVGAQIALEHHERWDGKGYPNQLSGSQITIAGRIAAVADVFDALGSNRCYKKAWPKEQIVDYFVAQRAKHFDPELVDILISHMDEFAAIRNDYPDPE